MEIKPFLEKIKDGLIKARSLHEKLSPNQAKAVNILATAPIIAATMDGACAGGCPYGLSYDPYPGQCGRYIDSNGTGACDLASNDVAAQQTTTSSSDSSSSDSSSQSSSSDSSTSSSNGQGQGGDGVDTSAADNNSSNVTVNDDAGSGGVDPSTGDASNFHILPASLIILGAYLLTYYLFKKGILKPIHHKRIWNSLLTFGFLGMGLTGVILTVMINLGIQTLRSGLTFWHVELSILMVLAALVHFHIYRRPFKRMFKVLFGIGSSKKDKKAPSSFGASK